MDYSNLLNEEQLKAVTTTSQYVKVVAGAGSGKTRVLTYRISYLMSNMNVYPSQILGITFTNKAAKEIKDRVISIYPDLGYMNLCTIHSWCARFLRQFYERINYPRNFTIIDEEDQMNIMKDIFVSHGSNKKDPQIKECLAWISRKKTEGLQYKDLEVTRFPNPVYNKFLGYFAEYSDKLLKSACLDFDDLLLKTIEILENYQDIKEIFNNKIKHILVDEFQDINDVQFYLIRLLMGQDTFLYVVGDPDQTIYTWRGANNKIILDLEKNLRVDYKNAEVETIILKNNYRSTKNILTCANMLISYNKDRVKKDLFPIHPEGEKVVFCNSRTNGEEAYYIVSTIKELVKTHSLSYKEFAVLYRSNYLTRELETQLNLHRIPYRIFGGQKFYQRREIKDIIAYMNLTINPLDDISFERIINVPRRNIGPTTVETIKNEADDSGQAMYLYVQENLNNLNIPHTKKNALKHLINLIENVKASLSIVKSKDYGQVMEQFIDDLKYFEYLKDDEKGDERIENVQALLGDVKAFFNENPNAEFTEFIENASLQASSDEINDGDYISLMTVHTAKGLEFNNVFIYGFNEGVFPSKRAVEENNNIEEERRLAYVAITRAKRKLYITCNQDYSYVIGTYLRPSRFLAEAGLKDKKPVITPNMNYQNTFINQNYHKKEEKKVIPQTNDITSWSVNDLLIHEQFGTGKVVEVVSDKLIKVEFDDKSIGTKTLLSSHFKIKKLIS